MAPGHYIDLLHGAEHTNSREILVSSGAPLEVVGMSIVSEERVELSCGGRGEGEK